MICKRCIMDDSSDATIKFYNDGCCNYCTDALKKLEVDYFPNIDNTSKLENLIKYIKTNGEGKKYDCMMGISGGLDSSYLAYLGAVKWGLRILAVHVDDGFDTEISKRNIDRLSKLPNLEMIYVYPDVTQYNELTKAYMRASVPNIAIPQDNILFAELYSIAKKYRIKSFLSGGNLSLESILQRGNTHPNSDVVNIKDIFKKFGTGKINKLKFMSQFKKDIYQHIYKIKTYRCLDLMEYNREDALEELSNAIGFEYYGSKHLENELTKFIQLYWFYKKYNVDKRKSHYSSMIVSGQMTREEATELMRKPLYDEKEMNDTITNILNKLNMSKKEFDDIMSLPTKQHFDYKVSHYLEMKQKLKSVIRR